MENVILLYKVDIREKEALNTIHTMDDLRNEFCKKIGSRLEKSFKLLGVEIFYTFQEIEILQFFLMMLLTWYHIVLML